MRGRARAMDAKTIGGGIDGGRMTSCSSKCPVYRQAEALRERCLSCRVCSDGNTMQCGGRGVVSVDAAEAQDAVIAHSTARRFREPEVYADAADGADGVTALPADVEDTLRRVTASFFGLRQVEVNLLWHLANGGTLATFGDRMGRFSAELGRYRSLDRRSAWSFLRRAGEAFGPFRALAGGVFGKAGRGPGSREEGA